MGPVFRAYDPDHDRLVAIKAFRLDLPPERVHQLIAEFEKLIAATPRHPSIVAPLSAGIEGVIPYLAQDYVAAESLDIALRQQGRATVSDAMRVADDLAGALDAAAASQIDHGVLHPRDVLLSADETRLTGLGVARALERVGVPTPVRRPYTAPERAVGSAWDRRADVFSLAALVYEMLWARRLAGAGDEAVRLMTDVPGGDLDALRTVFARALAVDPAERFDTALEFADALHEALPGAITGTEVAAGRIAPARGERVRLQPERAIRLRQEKAAQRSQLTQEAELLLPLEAATHPSSSTVVPAVGQGPAPVAEEEAAAVPELMVLRTEAAAPVIDVPAPVPDLPISPPDLFDSYRPAPDRSTPGESSPSSMWPLAFALLIGGAVGFAAGFGVGTRGRAADDSEPAAPSAVSVPVGRPPAAATTGAAGEFTEGTVTGPAAITGAPASGNDSNIPLPSSGGISSGRSSEPAAPAPARRVPPKPEPAPTGSLLVRSTPVGARVFVDNREYGRTPVTVNMLARGAHRVRVTQDGYVTDERRVTITAAQRAYSITVQLVADRAPAGTVAGKPAGGTARAAGGAAAAAAPAEPVLTGNGPLTVESRPPGATVFLDGKLVGTTPLTLPSVAAGDHAVHLDLEGFARWSTAVRIVPSAKNRIAASLDR